MRNGPVLPDAQELVDPLAEVRLLRAAIASLSAVVDIKVARDIEKGGGNHSQRRETSVWRSKVLLNSKEPIEVSSPSRSAN